MEKLLRLLKHLPSKRQSQLALVSIGLIVSSGSKALLVLGVGPFLMVLTGDNGVIKANPTNSVEMVETLSNYPIIACMLFGTFAILAGIAGLFSSWAIGRYTNCLSLDLQKYCLRSALSEPFVIHANRNSNHIISDIIRIQHLSSSVFAPIIQLLGASLTIISTLIVAFLVSWKATLISILLGGGIYIATAAKTKKMLKRDGAILVEGNRQLLVILREAFLGIRDVILDSKQAEILVSQEKVSAKNLATSVRAGLIQSTPRYLLESTGYLLLSAFGLASILSGENSYFNLATVGTLALAIQNLLPNMQQAFSCWTTFTSSQATIDIALKLLEPKDQCTERDSTWPANPVSEHLDRSEATPYTFNQSINLTAASYYHKPVAHEQVSEKPAGLSNIQLKISKGDILGISGKTGSGKSTLLDVIMGLLPLDSGDCLIDQQSLYKNVNFRRWWITQISHVPQEIFLSDASIVKNITDISNQNRIDWNKLEWACEQSQAIDFILSLPDSWNSSIGEQGSRLSGGQRQRLGLARALYRQRPLLILDESTSALDQQTETMVMEGIMEQEAKPTIIMVAHRLSTLEYCNGVILLDQGRIIKTGNLSEIQETINEKTHKQSMY